MRDELSGAFDRIDDFLAVQHVGRLRAPGDQMIGALHCLQSSVGIDQDERGVLRERIDAIARVAGPGGTPAPVHPGAVALGVIVGLMAAQLRDDS